MVCTKCGTELRIRELPVPNKRKKLAICPKDHRIYIVTIEPNKKGETK